MILLDNILLDEQILTQSFACDLKQCKGACCTTKGGAGAPLRDEEIELIESATPAALEYLTPRSATYIQTHGWYEGSPGEYATQCINDRDCVFVFYEGDIARCALERAYFEGNATFRKPLSCHLFPIRVADFGGTYLYYEEFSECTPALTEGKQTGQVVLDTAREALQRAFGEEWVEAATALSEQERNATKQ